MIIVPNDSSSSSSDTKKWVESLQDNKSLPPVPSPHDPPPSYLDSETLSTISSDSTSSRFRPIPNIKPSNFVSLTRSNDSIRESWLIDPSLSIPSSFLPPLSPTEVDRQNLFLESKNGTIDADVYLLSTGYSNKIASKYILIQTQSHNGSVKTRLHDVRSSNGETRLPVRLSTRSANGSIHVQLPRSFRGPIRIRTTHGDTQFSAPMRAQLTVFSDMDHVQRSFLGHFNPSQWEIGTSWEGDELSIETKNGNVKISFDDEPAAPMLGNSFLSRILGL